jgi:hypothetical protein
MIRPFLISVGAAIVLALPSTCYARTPVLSVSISDTGAAARNRVVSALIAEGVPVGSVAACDCHVGGAPVLVQSGVLSLATWVRIDAAILPATSGGTVHLTALMPGANQREVVFPVRPDTTQRMGQEERAAARLLQRIAARLQGTP